MKPYVSAILLKRCREMIEQWEKLPFLIESGQIIRQSGGWYRLADFKVMDQVSALVRSIATDRSGKVNRVQLEKPNRSLYKLAGLTPSPKRPAVHKR